MKLLFCATALLLAVPSAFAAEATINLSMQAAALLKGKVVAVTLHEPPALAAVTGGKALLGPLGGIATKQSGKNLVRDNGIEDPAVIIREKLAAALRDVHGADTRAVDTTATDATRAKEVANTHPEADYVLNVRTAFWRYGYYPGDWNNYQLLYSAQMQLVEVKSGRRVARAACDTSSYASEHPPTHEALLADGAKLLKEYAATLAWNCVRLLAKEQLAIADDKVPRPSEPYASLMAQFIAEDGRAGLFGAAKSRPKKTVKQGVE